MGFVGGMWARNNTKIDDGKMHHLVAVTEKDKGVRLYLDNNLASRSANNAFDGIGADEDGWLPAVGANLQGRINLSTPLEGEFIPMQDSLRVVVTSLTQGGGNNNSYSGVYRKVDHPEEALLIAAREGNKKKVEELLKAGVSPDTASRNSYGALGYAGIGGHLEIMKLLIAHKADVNRRARFMKTPLNVTAGSSHIASAKLLLANGAEVSLANGNGAFVTHESAFWGQPEMLEFLLTEAKVDPNLRSKNGQTALHYAMWNMVNGKDEFNKPYLKCIQLLLKHGTNPDLRGGNNNRTPLEMALNNGLSDVVALLEAQ